MEKRDFKVSSEIGNNKKRDFKVSSWNIDWWVLAYDKADALSKGYEIYRSSRPSATYEEYVKGFKVIDPEEEKNKPSEYDIAI